MRRWSVLAALLALVVLPLLVAGCGYGAAVPAGSANVVAADSLLNSKYSGAWWSHLFGGKNEAPKIGALQLRSTWMSRVSTPPTQKAAALARLSTAITTVDQLRADGAFSQTDANKVLAAISDIQIGSQQEAIGRPAGAAVTVRGSDPSFEHAERHDHPSRGRWCGGSTGTHR